MCCSCYTTFELIFIMLVVKTSVKSLKQTAGLLSNNAVSVRPNGKFLLLCRKKLLKYTYIVHCPIALVGKSMKPIKVNQKKSKNAFGMLETLFTVLSLLLCFKCSSSVIM